LNGGNCKSGKAEQQGRKGGTARAKRRNRKSNKAEAQDQSGGLLQFRPFAFAVPAFLLLLFRLSVLAVPAVSPLLFPPHCD
jgi:hypothetical protein